MTKEVQELASVLQQETDLEKAIQLSISGAVSVIGDGIGEINSLLAQIRDANNSGDTDTVKALTSVVQDRMLVMEQSRHALETATAQLASAVVANTGASTSDISTDTTTADDTTAAGAATADDTNTADSDDNNEE